MCTFHHSLFIILILIAAFIERIIASFQPCLAAATAQGRLVPHMLYIWRSTPRTLQAWVAHLACLVGPYFPHADGEAVGVEHVSAFNASLSFSRIFSTCGVIRSSTNLAADTPWAHPFLLRLVWLGEVLFWQTEEVERFAAWGTVQHFVFTSRLTDETKLFVMKCFWCYYASAMYFNILIIKWFPFFVSGSFLNSWL